MSRPLRIEFPGAHYHVTSRGNAQRKIFLDDVDREVFLVTLAWVVEGIGCSHISPTQPVNQSCTSNLNPR